MLSSKLAKNHKRAFLIGLAIVCFGTISSFATYANQENIKSNSSYKETIEIKLKQNPIPPECADPECRYNPRTRECICPGPR